MTSSADKSGPNDTDGRKTPASIPVLSLRDADRIDDAPAGVPPSPLVESTLVGNGDGLPPADRKDDVAGPSGAPKAETATTIPPVRDTARGGAPTPSPTTPVSSPTSGPAPQPSAPAPTARRGGFVPLVLGGAVAAGLGAAAAWYVMPQIGPRPDPAAATAQADALRQDAVAAATEAARAEIAAQAQALETRTTETAQAAATAAADAALKSASASLADQGAALSRDATRAAAEAGAEAARKLIAEAPASSQPDANLQATLSAQAGQLRALDEAVAAMQGGGAPADLTARLDAIDRQIAELAARPAMDADAVAQLQTLAQGAQDARAQIDAAAQTAAQQLSDVRSAADEAARKAHTAAAAATLAASLDNRSAVADRDAALAELEQAGVAAPAALAAQVVPLDQLRAEYDDAARAGLRAALRSGASGGGGITGFLRVQTGARSVTPREGSDPDAILSRAGDDVARGDIPAALAEIDALPEPAQQAMQDWTAKARAWVAARDAIGDLTATDPPAEPAAAPAEAAPAEPAPATAEPATTEPAPAQPAPAPETAAAPAAPSN